MSVRLLGAGDVRDIAGRIGVRPTKKLGQNFVVEQGTVRQIAAIAAPRADDVILEVGPGLGSLTLALLERAAEADARLVAVEVDPVLAAALPDTIAQRAPDAADRVTIIAADALDMVTPGSAGSHDSDGRLDGERGRRTVVALPEPPTVLAANLPYNVAVPVVLHLLAACPSLGHGVVMVQAEVADRMCASPGSRVYGVPSAKLAWYATARLAGTVPRSVFWPVPNVDSKLVYFTRHDPPLRAKGASRCPDRGGSREGRAADDDGRTSCSGAPEASREAVFAVIDAAFGQRRKTLRAALAGWAGSPAKAERILRAAGIEPGARGESLDVTGFARIAQAREEAANAAGT
jgi:16S rRNA (adenine1518-N6/adenine1519-N6)-dimethyltransferase